MARARNIKPSFFKNDELAEIDPLGRLLFIGLWSLCDFKGEMEWREKRVKAEILPYDNCNILELAINLDKSGFIRYYSSQGKTYVNVPSFTKHQNPHKNERMKGSEIPEYSDKARQAVELKGLEINRDLSGLKPEDSASDRADSCSLNPDSSFLIPDVKDLVAVAPVEQKKRFTPPIKGEVYLVMFGKGLSTKDAHDEADKFVDFYDSKGWMVGRNKMKLWKSAVNNWLKNYKPVNNSTESKPGWSAGTFDPNFLES